MFKEKRAVPLLQYPTNNHPKKKEKMKVTVDVPRVSHLAILLIASYGGGQFLVEHYDFSRLAAYGTSCYLVCQLSNIVLKFWERQKRRKISPSSLRNAATECNTSASATAATDGSLRSDAVKKANRAKTKK
jgi:hypothetical protein